MALCHRVWALSKVTESFCHGETNANQLSLQNPACHRAPSCVFWALALQEPMHSSPWGEWVQGNESICLFGRVFAAWALWTRGRAGACREGIGSPARTWVEAGISAELKIQEISLIWRELFLPHLPYPVWGCNEIFFMLVSSILFPCRTAPEEHFSM